MLGALVRGWRRAYFQVVERTPEQLRAEIEVTREATLKSLDLVRQELTDAFDWRTHYRRHSWQWLAVAAGVGFIIGMRTSK